MMRKIRRQSCWTQQLEIIVHTKVSISIARDMGDDSAGRLADHIIEESDLVPEIQGPTVREVTFLFSMPQSMVVNPEAMWKK